MNIEALKYYYKHKMSIIPVGKDKRPLIEWKEYQTRLASWEEIEKWHKDYPDMQIGIVTGEISKITVVDIDKPDMDLSWLPDTAIVKTGSGGFHYYYQYAPMPNKARIKEFIDIRGDGGYVVAPPSSNLKGEYKWLKKINPAPFPLHLFSDNPTPAKVQQVYGGQSQGGRNDAMTRYIGFLLTQVHPRQWDTLAWEMAQTANKKNQPPLQERELRTIFDSIRGKESGNNSPRWYDNEEPQVNLEIKKDYSSRYTWGTLELDRSFAIIKRGNFIIVGAKRSSGKTTWTFDMACKNALLGHKVLYLSLEMDEQKIKEDFARKYAGITIEEEYYYQIPEIKQQAYERKLKELGSIKNLYFRGMRRGSGTSWAEVVKAIGEFTELDFIIIDNLDLIDGDRNETNNDRQIRITKRIMNFTEEKQIPLLLIHHHRKTQAKDGGSDELSGSGKIGDNADIIIKISRNQDTDAEFPFNCESIVQQQKGRGYPNAMRKIYFIKGSFEDDPLIYQYENNLQSLPV